MSILLGSGNTENKPRLCATDGNNHLQINQTVIGFLSEFVSVGLHRVPYPGTGECENKVTSAYEEALKTVGYGRLEKPCTVYYNNPFDPRLTFDGLGHLLTDTETDTGSLSKEQLAQNVFLALENSDVVMDGFFSQNRNLYQALCSSTDLGLHVDPNRYKLFPEIDGNVSDDGSEDCKRMFEKICSLPIKDIWTDTQEKTESGTCSTDRKYVSPDRIAKKASLAKEQCQSETGETPPKTDHLTEKGPSQNKIRYSQKRLEGKKKSSVEPVKDAPSSMEEALRYDRIERELEQVVSEESDEEDRWRPSDNIDTPVLLAGDTGAGQTAEPQKYSSPPKYLKEILQTGQQDTKTEPTLPTNTAQHQEPDFPTDESRHELRQVPPDSYLTDPVPAFTTNETGSVNKEAKIQEFKKEMGKITARKDVPKTDVITGDPHITSLTNAPSQMEYPEFSLDSIVAKSVLRPGVPSFYPGFNKGGSADLENEHTFGRKTQMATHNRGTRPPPGIGQQHTDGDHSAHTAQGHWSSTPTAPQTQNTGHVATGNFQTHHTTAMRDTAQKMDLRSTLINPQPYHQPPNVNKLQMQPTHAAAAALLMANCIQQSSRKEVACTQPQQPPQNKPYNEFLPPIRLQQYQQQCSHLGMQNPYPGHAARNPPPGFNETTQAPIRNRDHPNGPYRSNQGHQHHLPIQQHLAFKLAAEQSLQHQPQQQPVGDRFPQPAVQNMHQHHLVQPQQKMQQQQHHHQQQQQPQQQHQQHNPNQLQQQQQHYNHNQQQQQQQQQPHHPHPPLHPLQPQPYFLNPEVPPFQYFNKVPQQMNMHANWHLNIQAENTNRNNANVDTYEQRAMPLISFNSSRLADDPVVKPTPDGDPRMKTEVSSSDSVRIKRMSVSAECIPSLVNGDCNRESSKDKHKVSKFRSRRSNLVRIYPSKDCS